MNEPLFSIVIPVFNIQNYIGECLESIINQSFAEFEAIVIDDGSTDKSGLICDEYASKDKRIKVIHQKNKGLSGARNTGIENSQGKWLLFLDGDDLYSSNALKDWYSIISSTSHQGYVAKYPRSYVNGEVINAENTNLKPFANGVELNKNLKKSALRLSNTVGWNVTRFCLSKEIIDKNALRFCEEIRYSEDLFWTFNYLLNTKDLYFADVDFYLYRVARDGCQTKQINKMMQGVIQTFKIFSQRFSNRDKTNNEKFVLSYLADVFLVLIGQGVNLDKEGLRIREQLIKENMYVLKNIDKTVTPSKRYLAQLAIKLFGINFADYIMNLLKR